MFHKWLLLLVRSGNAVLHNLLMPYYLYIFRHSSTLVRLADRRLLNQFLFALCTEPLSRDIPTRARCVFFSDEQTAIYKKNHAASTNVSCSVLRRPAVHITTRRVMLSLLNELPVRPIQLGVDVVLDVAPVVDVVVSKQAS